MSDWLETSLKSGTMPLVSARIGINQDHVGLMLARLRVSTSSLLMQGARHLLASVKP